MDIVKNAIVAIVENAFNKGNNFIDTKKWSHAEALEYILKDIITSTAEIANDLDLDIE
jgi:predicted aldo/keto reductase-like oxidoreductase